MPPIANGGRPTVLMGSRPGSKSASTPMA